MKLSTTSQSTTDSIDLSPPGIERCEPRLALSASLMGAWLAPLADPLSEHFEEPQQFPEQEFLPPCPAVTPGLAPEVNSPTSDLFPVAPAVLTPALDALTPQHLDSVSTQAALNWSANGNGNSLIEQSARIGHATGLDGSGQTIAVIDTGIAYDHHAFGAGYGSGQRVVGGWDFAENDADPYDDAPAGYHGSHVAGLASGVTTTINGDTFRGVAPGADLVALRVFDDAGNGNLAWVEQALRWVYDNRNAFDAPITTVNLSLGIELSDANRDSAMAMLEDELQALYEDDILVFAAAGNSYAKLNPAADDLMYPASSSWVSAVGSVDTHGNLSGFSQRVDGMFAAEGERLLSSVPEHVRGYDGYVNDYASLSGTSMASPQVAAASMLVRQAMQAAGVEATSTSILERLEATAVTHTDPTTGQSYRTLDLEAAVDFAQRVDNGGQGEATTIDGYTGGNGSDNVQLDLRGWITHNASGTSSAARPDGDIWLSDEAGRYRLNAASSANDPIVIDGGTGRDTLQIFGSSGAEQLILRPNSGGNAGYSQLVFPGGVIELRGFEHVSFVGGGGEDRATMYDSDGDDVLRSTADSAHFSGRGFEFELQDVNKVYVYATAGGNDTAHLNDTIHDDQLVIRPQFSSLRGGDRFRAAFGFERVFAYSHAGGNDTADLGDSVGDDVMSISQDRSLISGVGYRASEIGFDSVVATASQGGEDTVRIYVDNPHGTWHTSDSLTQWTGADGTIRIARGFEHSKAFELFERVPVGAQSIALETAAAPSPNTLSDLSLPWRTLDDIKRDADEHLRGLRQVFEDYV